MPDDGRVPPHGTAQPALRKHLMDPNAPRPVRDVESELRSLTRVQQWVMSVLVATTILHISAGLILAAVFLPQPTLSAEIGLNVIAGAFGVIAAACARAIHQLPLLSWWLLTGWVWTALGLYLTLR